MHAAWKLLTALPPLSRAPFLPPRRQLNEGRSLVSLENARVCPSRSFFLSFISFLFHLHFLPLPSFRLFPRSLRQRVDRKHGVWRDPARCHWKMREKCWRGGREREGRGIVVIGISRVLVNLVSPHQQVSGEPVSRCGPCSWERRRRRRTVAVVEFDLNPVEIVEGIAIDRASEWNVEIGRFRDLNRAYRDRSIDTK